MPLYEYGCEACGHRLEVQQKLAEAPLKTCPTCGKDALERLISATSFVLKGGGWYKDGYSGSGPKRTENQRGDRLEKAIGEDKKKTATADGGEGKSGSGAGASASESSGGSTGGTGSTGASESSGSKAGSSSTPSKTAAGS